MQKGDEDFDSDEEDQELIRKKRAKEKVLILTHLHAYIHTCIHT